MRNFLDLFDLTADEIILLLDQAERLKKAHAAGEKTPILLGRVLGLIFEKPSLRTRVSFEAAMAQLGGASVFLAGAEAGLGTRETVPRYEPVCRCRRSAHLPSCHGRDVCLPCFRARH
jgi:ornithine carbamoyltransferase